EDVQPAPLGSGRNYLARHCRHPLRVDPERLGAPAHLHARAAQLEIGVYSDRQPWRHAFGLGDSQRAAGLVLGFEVERDASADRGAQFGVALSGASETYPGGVEPGIEREAQLAPGRDVEAVDQTCYQFEDWRVRICF